MSNFDMSILKDLRIAPIDIHNGTQCNSAKCPLTRAFSRVFRKNNPTYYAEVGNYQSHIYQKLDRQPCETFIHGENLKAWIRFYDERMPAFPVKIELVEDKDKVYWLTHAVYSKAGDALSKFPPHKTHYLEIPSSESEAILIKDLHEDNGLPVVIEVDEAIIERSKPFPMLNPIALALSKRLGGQSHLLTHLPSEQS